MREVPVHDEKVEIVIAVAAEMLREGSLAILDSSHLFSSLELTI